MPIKKSAIKRAKQNLVRRDNNRVLKKAFRLDVKEIAKKIKSGKVKEAEKMIPDTYKALDKAAKRGAIHKNNASRRKSRLMKKINEAFNKSGVEPEKPKAKKPSVKKNTVKKATTKKKK